MLFALGYICGVATCAFLFAVIAAFRIDRIAEEVALALRRKGREVAQKLPPQVSQRVVRGGGFVSVPEDDDEAARREIIEENNRKGLPTPISDLRS